jgi:hypothetical protein
MYLYTILVILKRKCTRKRRWKKLKGIKSMNKEPMPEALETGLE